MSYRHIDFTERQLISDLLQRNCSQAKIARLISRSRSTVKREIERNGYTNHKGERKYIAEFAERFSQRRKSLTGNRRKSRTFYRRDLFPTWCQMDKPLYPRNDKPQGYRFRSPWHFEVRNDRESTQLKDKKRYRRESEWRDTRPKEKRRLWQLVRFPAWLLPKRLNRKKYYHWPWIHPLRKFSPIRDRKRKADLLLRPCKKDLRNRPFRQKKISQRVAGSFWQRLNVPLPDQSQHSSVLVTIKNTYGQKPQSFRMESLCPDNKVIPHFSKIEPLLRVG